MYREKIILICDKSKDKKAQKQREGEIQPRFECQHKLAFRSGRKQKV